MARIARAALHKLPGKSSLNISFSFPDCPVCPVHDHYYHNDHHNQYDHVDHEDHGDHEEFGGRTYAIRRLYEEVGGCTHTQAS